MNRYIPSRLPPAVAKIVKAVPELENSYKVHISEHDGSVLGYIFLPDAVRELENQERDGRFGGDTLDRLSQAIEDELASSDPATEDLIALGLLEELANSSLWGEIRKKLGQRARAQLREMGIPVET